MFLCDLNHTLIHVRTQACQPSFALSAGVMHMMHDGNKMYTFRFNMDPTGEDLRSRAYATPSNASESLGASTAVPAAQGVRGTSSFPGESSEMLTAKPAAEGDVSSSSIPRGDNDFPTSPHTQEEAFSPPAENVDGDSSRGSVSEAVAGRDDLVSCSTGADGDEAPDRGTDASTLLGDTSSSGEGVKEDTARRRNDGSSCENDKSDEIAEEKIEEGGQGQSVITRIGLFFGKVFGK